MTAPQQPEPGKHCEHECMGEVCARYRLQGSRGFPCSANNGEHSTVGKQCKHDTRQRKVPEGERMYAITESELKKYEGLFFLDDGATSDFKKIRSRPLSDMCMERNWAQGQPQDAAAGKAAVLNELRTEVLKRIDEQSACAKKGHVGSRETDLINAAYREIIGDIDYALRTTPASGINPTESDGRGYRCLHCEIRNGSLFCHYHDVRIVSLQEHDEQVKREAREEVLNEICAINKGDGCCNGQPHGKDCFDCAFIHLRSEVKKE